MHFIWHEMFKIASVSGAPPQTPLGELTTLPQTPQSLGASFLQQSQLCAFGPSNFPDSHFYQCKKTQKLSHCLKSLKICPAQEQNRWLKTASGKAITRNCPAPEEKKRRKLCYIAHGGSGKSPSESGYQESHWTEWT